MCCLADGGLLAAVQASVAVKTCNILQNSGPALHGISLPGLGPSNETQAMLAQNDVLMTDQQHSEYLANNCAYCYVSKVSAVTFSVAF